MTKAITILVHTTELRGESQAGKVAGQLQRGERELDLSILLVTPECHSARRVIHLSFSLSCLLFDNFLVCISSEK